MGSDSRQEHVELMRNCHQYNFFRLFWLLEANGWLRQVVLSAPVALSFHAATLNSCRNQLRLNFMGVVESSCCSQQILNAIVGRLSILFYEAWKKYQPLVTFASSQLYLMALSGNVLQDNLQYTAVFGRRVHNGNNLVWCLTDLLQFSVQIQELVCEWRLVKGNNVLGKDGLILNDSFLLGEYVLTTGNKVNVKIGSCGYEFVRYWLLNENNWRLLLLLIKAYLKRLSCEIWLLYRDTKGGFMLNGKQRLGWQSYLGVGSSKLECLKIAI